MKLLNVLRKLGIVRFGAVGGSYKSYKEMPDELMFDNAYDKKTDLVDNGARIEPDNTTKNAKKWLNGDGPAVLFYLLAIITVLITLFFGLMVDFNYWFVVLLCILLVFLFKLYRYKHGLVSLKFIWLFFVCYFIIASISLFIAILSNKQKEDNLLALKNGEVNKADSDKTDYADKENNESEWIEYTGVKSDLFTFRYPKTYKIEESGTSVLVFVDKENDYDHHLQFSVLDSGTPAIKDCEQFVKMVAAGFKNGEVRYVKQLNISGVTGCDYGLNSEQDGDKIYGMAYAFNAKNKDFGINSYSSKKLSDLDILSKVMQSVRLK